MEPLPDTDSEVIDRVLRGEVDAFRTLVERYQRQIFHLGVRFHRRREDAEDYVQEVFVRAFSRLSQFRADGRFYSWLMRIAYNQGIDRVGRRGIEYCPQRQEPVDDTGDPEFLTLRELARQELRTAVARLPRKASICIDLFFFFGLTYQEVADTTGIPVNTVKSHVFRAKRHLRGMLAGGISEVNDEL